MKTYIRTKTYTRKFIVTLFIIIKTGTIQMSFNRTSKLWYIHTIEFILAIKRNKLLIQIIRINLKNDMPNQRSKTKILHTIRFHYIILYKRQNLSDGKQISNCQRLRWGRFDWKGVTQENLGEGWRNNCLGKRGKGWGRIDHKAAWREF